MNENISSVITETTINVGIDAGEIVLDNFLDNEILKDFPVISTITSVLKLGTTITDAIYLRNFCIFLQELKRNKFSDERDKYKDKMKNHKDLNKIIDCIVIYNSKYTTINKPKILANLFKSLLDEKIIYDEYQFLCETLELVNKNDINVLYDISKCITTPFKEIDRSNTFEEVIQISSLTKLTMLGLLDDGQRSHAEIRSQENRLYRFTRLGNVLFEAQ